MRLFGRKFFSRWLVMSVLTGFVSFLPTTGLAADPALARFVDPFIGTAPAESSDFSGNTYPGAQVPWGMASPSPHTRLRYPGGYVHGDPQIYGFGQNHRSGGGCGDLGNILFMPTSGELKTTEGDYQSSYTDESATAGFYRVHLTDAQADVEMTATERVSVYRVTFATEATTPRIVLDVSHSLENREQAGSVAIVSPTKIEGSIITGSHCGSTNAQPLYFVAETSQLATETGTWQGPDHGSNSAREGVDIGGYWGFGRPSSQPIVVKIGLSYTGLAGARANLEAEVSGFDFEAIKSQAQAKWEQVLGRAAVQGGNPTDRTIVYTSLYHSLLQPSIFSDLDGSYPAAQGKGVRQAIDHTQYTIFPTWDQFRTLHPLLTLLYPEREHDMIASLLAIGDETGWLPKWELLGYDNRAMIGDHTAAIIAGAYLKGIDNFAINKAYDLLKKSATDTNSPNRPGLADYLKYHYIPEPTDGVYGSVSSTVEYAFDDAAMSKLATALGRSDDAKEFARRANFYTNLYNEKTGFLQPKRADGSWFEPFDPAGQPQFPGPPGFVEGDSWNYTFLPSTYRDPLATVALFGGVKHYLAKVNEAFQAQHITLNNEPDTSFAYLYNLIPGQGWRTQVQVVADRKQKFTATSNGLPGNDDEGSLSSVYVFDALGLFPVNPASGEWQIGTPLFPHVTLTLSDQTGAQRPLEIVRDGSGDYVASLFLDQTGQPCLAITQQQLTQAHQLRFQMRKTPTNLDGLCESETSTKGGFLAYAILYLVTLLAAVSVLVRLARKKERR